MAVMHLNKSHPTPGRFALRKARARRSAFTLIEILIVVVILGILAGVVIPQLSTATHQSREATLRDALRYLRTQIGCFRVQHKDISPGYPGGDTTQAANATVFVTQMTAFTDEAGNTNNIGSDVFHFGPYLTQMPSNPLSAKVGILITSASPMPAPDESQPYGWIYNPATQQIIANSSGTDLAGIPYTNY